MRPQMQLADKTGKVTPAGEAARRILVVEDEPVIALDLLDVLAGAGFKALGPASSLEKALEKIAACQFDAVLLDCKLGSVTSAAVAAELTRKRIPYLVVTAYDKQVLPEEMRGAPMLAKPIDADNLLQALRELLA